MTSRKDDKPADKTTSRKERLRAWLHRMPCRIVDCLMYSMIALAVLIIIASLLVIITGNTGSLNRLLSSNIYIFSSPTYHPDTDFDTLMTIFRNFYPGLVPLLVVLAIIVPIVGIFYLLVLLSFIGRHVVELADSFVEKPSLQSRLLTGLALWTIVIVMAWIMLNIDTTIYYLITFAIALVIGELLIVLSVKLTKSGAKSESSVAHQ